MKPLTVKINTTSVEILESLTKHYKETINMDISKAQIIQTALTTLLTQVKKES